MGQGSAFGIKATAFVDTGSNLPIRPAYPRSCRPTDRRPGRKGRFFHQSVPIRISLKRHLRITIQRYAICRRWLGGTRPKTIPPALPCILRNQQVRRSNEPQADDRRYCHLPELPSAPLPPFLRNLTQNGDDRAITN